MRRVKRLLGRFGWRLMGSPIEVRYVDDEPLVVRNWRWARYRLGAWLSSL